MKRRHNLIVIALCVAMGLSACTNKVPGHEEELEIDKASPVEVIITEKDSIKNDYIYSGTIKAANEVTVNALIQGKVAKVNYNVGDIVEVGDVLFIMDTKDIENNIATLVAAVESAEASVVSARTNLNYVNGGAMQTQIENSKIAVSNAEFNVESMEISLNKAKLDYENNKELFEAGIIAKDILIQVEDGYNKAQIAYNQAKTSLEQAVAMYDITKNQIPEENLQKAQDAVALSEASKKSALAQLEGARAKLDDARVMSPISGIISECNIKAGELISVAGALPMQIIDNKNVNIEVGVSEQLVNNIYAGDVVKVLVKSVSEQFMEGNIISISPAARQDNTYNVKIQIENEELLLKPGMFGEVYFNKEHSEDTIILPRSAVLEDEEGYYVFIEDTNLAKRIDVLLGIESEAKVEVVSGLEEGMSVVVTGQNYLEDGNKLVVVSNGRGE